MKFKIIIVGVVVLAVAAAGFMFRDQLFNAAENLQHFQQTDLANLVNQIKQEVFSPSPLNTGFNSKNGTLTKAGIVAETNRQRHENGGLPALKTNAKLEAAAQAKAEDMFKNQYFEHESPSGVGPAELVQAHGYSYIVTGENLILGNFKDDTEAVQLWMDSPGHRANILNNRYMEIGVAVVKGIYEGKTAWIGVQEFGLPMSSCSQPSASVKSSIDADKARLDQLAAAVDAKKTELENTSRRSSQYNQKVDEYNALVNQYNDLLQKSKVLINQYNNQVNEFNACVAGK